MTSSTVAATADAGGGRPELAAILIDVPSAGFDAAVAFWAGALGATPETAEELPGGGARYVHLVDAAAVTDVLVQRTDDDRARFHLDVAVDDRVPVVAAVVSGGARRVQHEDDWDVLADPAGLLVCVGFEGDRDTPRVTAPPEDRGHLDAFFVDVDAANVDAEVAFWTALLGAERGPTDGEYQELHGVKAVGGVAVSADVQAVGHDPDRDGPAAAPRYHVDLSARDVAAEVDRLVALGARRVAEIEDWVVLADPNGLLFCVVPRSGREEVVPRSGREEVVPRSGREEVVPRSGREEVVPRSGREEVVPRSGREEIVPRDGEG